MFVFPQMGRNAAMPGIQFTNSLLNQGCNEPVVRQKEFKNKENRSKNAVSQGPQEHSPNTGSARQAERVLRQVQDRGNNQWQPELRLKKYESGSDQDSSKKVDNSSKQKKDSRNNFVHNNFASEGTGAVNDGSMQSIHVPGGLDPFVDPKSVRHHVYEKGRKIPNTEAAAIQHRQTEPIHLPFNQTLDRRHSDSDETSLKVCNTPLKFVRNTLITKPNVNNKNAVNILIPCSTNDLETDHGLPKSENSNKNTTLLKFQQPQELMRSHIHASSSSSLQSNSIVVPYQPTSRSLSDSSLQFQAPSLSPGSLGSDSGSPHNIITTISFSTHTTPAIATTPIATPFTIGADVPSTLRFGDINSLSPASLNNSLDPDFIMAQQLQRQFDEEAMQNGHSIGKHGNQTVYARSPSLSAMDDQPGFRSGDFRESGDFSMLRTLDGPGFDSVYDPHGLDEPPRLQSANLYIPCTPLPNNDFQATDDSTVVSRPEITIPVSHIPSSELRSSPIAAEPIHVPHVVETTGMNNSLFFKSNFDINIFNISCVCK